MGAFSSSPAASSSPSKTPTLSGSSSLQNTGSTSIAAGITLQNFPAGCQISNVYLATTDNQTAIFIKSVAVSSTSGFQASTISVGPGTQWVTAMHETLSGPSASLKLQIVSGQGVKNFYKFGITLNNQDLLLNNVQDNTFVDLTNCQPSVSFGPTLLLAVPLSEVAQTNTTQNLVNYLPPSYNPELIMAPAAGFMTGNALMAEPGVAPTTAAAAGGAAIGAAVGTAAANLQGQRISGQQAQFNTPNASGTVTNLQGPNGANATAVRATPSGGSSGWLIILWIIIGIIILLFIIWLVSYFSKKNKNKGVTTGVPEFPVYSLY